MSSTPRPFPIPERRAYRVLNEYGRWRWEVGDRLAEEAFAWLCSRALGHLYALAKDEGPIPNQEALDAWLDELARAEGGEFIISDYDADGEHLARILDSALWVMTGDAAEFALDVFDFDLVHDRAAAGGRISRRRRVHSMREFVKLTKGGRGTVAEQVAATGWTVATVKRHRADLRRVQEGVRFL